MHTIVINLDRGTERWSCLAPQFASAGLEATRLPAVDGDRLGASAFDRVYSRELNRRLYHRPLLPGELGCYASHLAAWRRLVASSDRCLAVFEDDIDLDPALPEALDAIERSNVPFDMIKLAGRTREKVAARSAPLGAWELVRYRRIPGHTSAYVISRRGAAKLLAGRVPFGRPVDVDLRHHWECGLTVLGLLPYPVRLAECSRETSIEGRHGQAGLAARWRKFALQARYTLLNAGHDLVDPSPRLPDAVRGRPATPPRHREPAQGRRA